MRAGTAERTGGRGIRRWAATVCVLAGLLAGCAAALPPLEGRSTTAALTDPSSTRLGRVLAADVAAHPGRTGAHPLVQQRDAFAKRALHAAAGETSLDVQY
jgi:cardiolipin synthase C